MEKSHCVKEYLKPEIAVVLLRLFISLRIVGIFFVRFAHFEVGVDFVGLGSFLLKEEYY